MIACAFLVSAAPLLGAPDVSVPHVRELKALLAELQAVEPHRADSRARRHAARALRRARSAVGLQAEEALKSIEKAWESGRELPRKGGEHWYWRSAAASFFLSRTKPRGSSSACTAGRRERRRRVLGAYRGAADKRGWLSIYPQALEATERGWTDSGEEWIMTLIDEARRTFDVPADKVFIGGTPWAATGPGCWARTADLFAAVPSAGSLRPSTPSGPRTSSTSRRASSRTCGTCPCACSRHGRSTGTARTEPGGRPQGRGVQGPLRRVRRLHVLGGGGSQARLSKGGTEALLARIDGFTRDPTPNAWSGSRRSPRRRSTGSTGPPATGVVIDATVDRDSGTIEVRTNGEAPGLAVLLEAIVDMEASSPSRSTTPRCSRACPGRPGVPSCARRSRTIRAGPTRPGSPWTEGPRPRALGEGGSPGHAPRKTRSPGAGASDQRLPSSSRKTSASGSPPETR